ncbi:MAG: hypothetical protein R3B90_08455 [Planctomycetaceae bacterium]
MARPLNSIAVCLTWAAVLLPSVAKADDQTAADAIRKLIPAAAAMSKADFERLATSPNVPKVTEFEEQSLTLLLIAMPASVAAEGGELTEEQQAALDREFRYLGDAVKPAQLAREIYRSLGNTGITLGPTTFIHADRIREFSCEVDGAEALGEVVFHVPRLYEGRVQYRARLVDGKWEVHEFEFPARKLRCRLGMAGKWEQVLPEATEAAKPESSKPAE